ncbi:MULTISPECIES: FAD-binding oxidoreductase [Halorussus]|uniref:NAD(P)/FAD-dependent oxidoreductase n=1 Tax=Halorussus TaxID=1070314 RepID=UPI000E20C9D9|nr:MULTISPECIES: FAD-dependent oxidoreductase [Halorussus]NHN61161.1 FAD-binding oxidoreductase [Halorussus sp. JP-T4]
MDVAVVGGGIVGLASAYYLAERGADVTVYEKGSLGNGSTERSVGGIRAQFSTPVNVDLSLESMDVWESFESTFGTDIAYRRPGYLFAAREPATARAFEEQVAMQNDRGVPSVLLDPEEATEHCPGLRADQFVAATYSPTDGFADPHLALQGFAAAAREAGAEILTQTDVTAIHRERGTGASDDAVTGVTADGERSDASRTSKDERSESFGSERRDVDFVVNAAGPWARRVAAMAAVEIPVAPKRRQMAVVDPETPVPEDVPLTIDLDTGSHFRPEREGAALVGGHFESEEPRSSDRASGQSPRADGEERPASDTGGGADPNRDPDGFDRKMDLDWAAEAVERAGDCATYFGPDSELRRGWAGLYAVTPDHHPIVEETVPGFVQAVGFSGHGFQHAPATGQLVAELVLDGEASLVDVSALGSDRFERGDLLEERNVA